MSQQWFFNRMDGYGVQGPFELSHLVKLLQEGELAPNHEVRAGVIGQWSSAEDLKWYYNLSDGSGVQGPATRAQLQEFLDAEQIPASTLIRAGWSGEWQPLPVVLGLVEAPVEKVSADSVIESENLADDDFELNLDAGESSIEESPATTEATPDEGINPDDDVWYCEISGQIQGPLPWSRIHSLASMGRMLRDDHIRHGTERQWKLADDFAGLFPKPVSPTPAAPPTNQSVSQTDASHEAPTAPAEEPPQANASLPTAATPPAPQAAEAVDAQKRDKLAEWLNNEVREPDPPPRPPISPVNSASNPAGTPAANSPVKQSPSRKVDLPPKPKSKSRSSGPGLGEFLSSHLGEIKENVRSPLVFWLLGLIVVVGLIYGAIFLFGLSGGEDVSAYAVYHQFWERYKSLRAKEASNAEWKELEDWTVEKIKPIVTKLELTATTDRSAEQNLLRAGRDLIPKMLKEGRKAPSQAETSFVRSLRTVHRLYPSAGPEFEPDPAFQK